MFYNFLPPFEDEFLYSWYYRLADMNGHTVDYFLKSLGYGSYYYYDRNDFSKFYKMLPEGFRKENNIVELFNRLYIFNLYALSMSFEKQAQYVCTFGADHDFFDSIKVLIKTFKVCPECLAEEKSNSIFETRYLHRSHQVYGVTVCHKHGCPLLEIKGSKSFFRSPYYDDIYDESNFIPVEQILPYREAYEYAVAVNKLLKADLYSGGKIAGEVIDRKLKDSGYKNGIFGTGFIRSLKDSPYGPLVIKLNGFYESKKAASYAFNHLSGFIVAALFAYKGKLDEFMVDLEKAKVGKNCYPVPEGLELQNSSGVLNSYRCKTCGNIFMQTGWGVNHGIGCPECDSKNPGLFAERLIRAVMDDEYEIIGDVKSTKLPVKLLHKKCGNTIEVTPIDFISKRERCYCNKIIDFKEARKRVSEAKGFELKSYKRKGNIAVISHVGGCGKDFEINLMKFCRSPRCRYCEWECNNLNYKDRIRELVGDEYEVLSDYVKSSDLVILKHTTCGHIFKVTMSKFFWGYRCPDCSKSTDVNNLVYMIEKYTSGHYIVKGLRKKNNLIIENVLNGENFVMEYGAAKQEILRPTPSDKFSLTAEEEKNRIKMLAEGGNIALSFEERFKRFDRYLRNRFGPNDVIFIAELNELDENRIADILLGGIRGKEFVFEYKKLSRKLIFRYMRYKGYLKFLCNGVYVFPENNKTYSPEDLFIEKYVCRSGKIIGRMLYPEETGEEELRCESSIIDNKKDWLERSIAGFTVKTRGI